MRNDVLGIGVVVLIAGIAAYLYEQQATLFGYTYSVGYPYRDLGEGLIILGVVALIIGAAMRGDEILAPLITGKSQGQSHHCPG